VPPILLLSFISPAAHSASCRKARFPSVFVVIDLFTRFIWCRFDVYIRDGSLYTGSEISHFEIVESDKAGASDEACEEENSKFVGIIRLPNDSATWPVFMSRNVRNYVTQRDEPPAVTSQLKSSTEKREWWDTVFYVPLQRWSAKWWSSILSMSNILGIENRICCYYCKLFSSKCVVYTKYLVSEGIECRKSCIYWVLQRCCPLKSILEKWNWGHAPALPFTSMIAIVMTWCPLQKFLHCTRHEWSPTKVLPIRPRTC